MNAVTFCDMAILEKKSKNIRGGRPKKRFGLNIDRETRNLCIFMGYAPKELKKGEEVSLSLKDFEELLMSDDLRGRVRIRIQNRLSFRRMMVNCVKSRLSSKPRGYPQTDSLQD